MRIGIVGNRDLTGCNEVDLRSAIVDLIGSIQAHLKQTRSHFCSNDRQNNSSYYSPLPYQITMVNSLAEGVDQLAAEAAIEANLIQNLCVPSPFTVKEYKANFMSDVYRDKFDALIKNKNISCIISELDCSTDPEHLPAGYEAAADILLDNTDILIAIFDKNREAKTGGSRETVDIALKRDIPVIYIDPYDPAKVSIFQKNNDSLDTKLDLSNELLIQTLNTILLPPEKSDKKAQFHSLSQFYSEPVLLRKGFLYRLSFVLYGFYANFWNPLVRLARLLDRGDNTQNKSKTEPSDNGKKQQVLDNPFYRLVDKIRSPFRDQLDHLDRLSVFYMGIYRGSFVLNFLLGAFAVLFALLSVFGNQFEEIVWIWAELVSLTLILATYVSSRIWKWHDRATDYRFIAEFFRHMEMLAPLGRTAPLMRAAPYKNTHDPGNSWMGWYLSAIVRSEGPFGICMLDNPGKPLTISYDKTLVCELRDDMCKNWLEDQLTYHHAIARRFALIEKIAKFVMLTLFFTTFVIVAWHFLSVLQMDNPAPAQLTLTTLFAAALPAFLAAIHGISVQGEFEQLAERSESTAKHLAYLVSKFKCIESTYRPSLVNALSDQSVEAASIMLDEVLDWRILYKVHSVELT